MNTAPNMKRILSIGIIFLVVGLTGNKCYNTDTVLDTVPIPTIAIKRAAPAIKRQVRSDDAKRITPAAKRPADEREITPAATLLLKEKDTPIPTVAKKQPEAKQVIIAPASPTVVDIRRQASKKETTTAVVSAVILTPVASAPVPSAVAKRATHADKRKPAAKRRSAESSDTATDTSKAIVDALKTAIAAITNNSLNTAFLKAYDANTLRSTVNDLKADFINALKTAVGDNCDNLETAVGNINVIDTTTAPPTITTLNTAIAILNIVIKDVDGNTDNNDTVIANLKFAVGNAFGDVIYVVNALDVVVNGQQEGDDN